MGRVDQDGFQWWRLEKPVPLAMRPAACLKAACLAAACHHAAACVLLMMPGIGPVVSQSQCPPAEAYACMYNFISELGMGRLTTP